MVTMATMPSGLCHLKIGICLNIEEEEDDNFDLEQEVSHLGPEKNLFRNNHDEKTFTKTKVC